VRHVVARVSKETGAALDVPADVLAHWMSLEWAGNVRELENHVRRCVALTDDPVRWTAAPVSDAFPAASRPMDGRDDAQPAAVSVLAHLLERHDGNLAAVARQLGVSRQAVWKQVRRAGLRFASFRPTQSAFRTYT
jgi:transcriptional regulator of acetoin/glycerol metabolism